MSANWDTKWGSRRVRHDPPTLTEALTAAQGFTDDVEEQAVIAAGLMGVDVADARAALQQLAPERRASHAKAASKRETIVSTRDKRVGRTVVVERKSSRRFLPTTNPSRLLPPAGRPR